MLVPNARFVLLAAFCSLATLGFSSHWGVGAAAIQTQTRSFDRGHCHDVTSDQPPAQYVLPFPLQSKIKRLKRTHEWLHSDLLAIFADVSFAGIKRDGSIPRVKCRIKNGDYSDPAEIARRSVVIPDNHGSKYVVSHSRRPVQRRRRPKVRRLNGIEETQLSQRSQDAMPVMGNVALMSPVYGSTTGRQLATLFAAPDPNDPGAWTLYASEANQTQFQLVNAPASTESIPDLTPVTLEMGAPGETRTCATYNSNPQEGDEAENMTMEPCADRAVPEEDDKSQIFMYNSTSGTLSPTWKPDADGANEAAASSPLDPNSTTLSNATATSSAVQAAATKLPADREDVPPNPTRQNSTVTLVFTPLGAMVEDVNAQRNSTTTGTTPTMTKTVTVFNVASTFVGLSFSVTSNTPSQATSTSSALNVQLVGAAMPFSNGTGSASVSTSYSTATRSIDAAAVASRIAMSASASSASAAGSSTVISSPTASASPSSTQAAQRRGNGRLAASDWKVTTVSTEPYTWMFKAEER